MVLAPSRGGPTPLGGAVSARRLLGVLAAVQAVLGLRVVLRLVATARGTRIGRAEAPPGERVAVVVPVLDERDRLRPCLVGLAEQGPEVAEILVVDGGSADGTQALVAAFAARDRRVRLVDASPVPPAVNGKAHGLRVGVDASDRALPWVLTVDADVRPRPGLVAALLAHARETGVAALSAATEQELSGPGEGVVHPALLATLVYRFGIPGHAVDRVAAVQANGQCFLARRDALGGIGGFGSVLGSVCEDVTLARGLVAAGHRVGFYETDGLVSVAMYAGWRDAWRNWTRSLPLRDRYWGLAGPIGLAEVLLVQASPLPLLALLRARPLRRLGRHPIAMVNAILVVVRLGTLAGMGRAYRRRPWTYWLSPLVDLPVAVQLVRSAARRRHTWRGRPIVRGGT